MTVRGRFRHASFSLIFVLLACSSAPPSLQRESASVDVPSSVVDPASNVRAELSAKEAPDGGIVALSVELPAGISADGLHGEFDREIVPLFSVGEGRYEGYVGVPHAYKPGPAVVTVRYVQDGAPKVVSLGLLILPGGYLEEHLKVEGKHVNPPARTMRRILREQKEVGAVYRRILAKKHWKGPFVLPIDSPFTSPYGTKRLYNGESRNPHTGIDLKATVGTPIVAPAPGEVVMAKNLYFTGGTVIIDHGYGVMTLYAHMSKIRVKKGQLVRTRQLLGLAGATGRVSGPHLHWTTIVNKIKVNPVEFLKVVK
jgi:murein DD-endopeptidase MepM/ murein hydrolase activator NlpD